MRLSSAQHPFCVSRTFSKAFFSAHRHQAGAAAGEPMFGLHVRARLLARGARANWVRQAQGCLSFVARTRSSVTAISATLPTTNAMGDPAHRFASVRYMATDVEPREIVDFEDDDLDGATAAEAITQAIAPTPWKSVVELPPKLRELIIKQTGDFSSTQLHYMFTEMCRELAERTATNLTQHHPESPESRAGAAIYQPPFVYSPTYTLAFTAYRAPIQFSILQRVMAEISTRRPDFTPKRVLDFGAGCGMAAWALDNVWPGETQAYTAIEPSRSMVDMAQKLLEDFPGVKFEGSITKFLEHNSIQRGERTSSGAAGVAKKVAFDMCIGSFLLGELTSDNARAAATKILFDQLRPGGIAVFAEPATPWGLRCVDSARQFLLANYSTPDSRNLGTAEVLAPWIPWYELHCGASNIVRVSTRQRCS